MCFVAVAANVAMLEAVDKDKWSAGPASSYQNKQTISGVTVAAVAHHTEALAKPPFGKVNPYQHGILPVLVAIENSKKTSVKIGEMKVEYIDADRSRIEATPAGDVKYTVGPRKPNMIPSPIPGLGRGKKNPLTASEIESRAFSAKMLPPGESASGFFYFQTPHHKGAKLYITGLLDAATGNDLFYFEIPLD